MIKYQHYLNGQFVTEDNLLISPRDLGFTRSFAVFDYIRTYEGKPFKLLDHVERLLRSTETIKLKHDFTVDLIIEIVEKLLILNNDGREKSIKIIISGGPSNGMYQTGKPTLVIYLDPFKPKDPKIYTDGVVLSLLKYERDIPDTKNTNYIEGVRQAHINNEKGIFEPLYYSDSQVYETSNSNIFVVKDGKIYTPKDNIFLGAARGVIVNDLKEKLNVIEENFNLDFLFGADEVFLSSSGKEVAPVVKIESIVIGKGEIGPVTKHVWNQFKEFVRLNA